MKNKIEIARSFSKKIQLKQYEPIEFFCSAKMEISSAQEMSAISEMLDKFVQSEVEKSANKFKAVDIKKIKDTAIDEAEHDAG